MPQTQREVLFECPRCEGYREEPGAPVDIEGVALCSLCNGHGVVTIKKAKAYKEED